MARRTHRIAEHGIGSSLATWAVALISTAPASGCLGLNRSMSCRESDEAELGFRLARAYRGQGYGLEMARLGLQHAFESALGCAK